MKIRLGELRELIRESVLSEISDPDKAHQRLVDLTQETLDNPQNSHSLTAFLRTLGATKQMIVQMRKAIQDGDEANAMSLAHDFANELLSGTKSKVMSRPKYNVA